MNAAKKRRSRWSRVLAGIAAGALAVGVLTFVSAPAAQSATATGGTGRFLSTINWFSWGANGAPLANNTTRTNTITVGGQQMAITCTISDLQGTGGLASYRPGDWRGDGLDEMYNIGGTGGNNQLIVGLRGGPGGNANFDLDCSATFDGDPIELAGMVIADAEQSGSAEYVGATAPVGATWRIIDRYRVTNCNFSTLGFRKGARLELRTSMPETTPCAAGPTTVAFLEDATSLDDVTVVGQGISAVAVGVAITLDFGDAPASYDVAGAVSQFRYTGGTIPESTGTWNLQTNPGVDLFGSGFSLASPAAPHIRLGSNTDIETAQPFSANALGDDGTGQTFWGGPDDETLAIPSTNTVLPGGTLSLPVACSGTSQLAGWIDWNRNGTFDTPERSAVRRCATGASLTWDVPTDIPADGATYPTFARIRTGKAAGASPTGFTPDGEVEDHRFAFTTPAPDAVDDTANTPADTAVTVPVLANDNAGAGATMQPSTVVFTSTDATDSGRRLDVPGEGVYTIDPATGSVTFTPAAGFTGRATPVEYRAFNNTASVGPGSTALVTVTVGGPSTAADDAATTPQNVTVAVDPLENDRVGDDGTGVTGTFDPRSVVLTSPAAVDGGKRLEVPGEGVWTVDPQTGVIRFDPEPAFRGTGAPVAYSVGDSFGNNVSAEVTVQVTPVTPRAVDDEVTVAFDTPLTFDVVSNDEPGAPSAPLDRRSVVFTSPAATDGERSLDVPGQGSFSISPTTGDVTFTPVDGFSGAVDPVAYRVSDENGTTTDAVIRARITEPPTANPDTLTTPQNVTATIDPLGNDGPGRTGTFDRGSVVFTSPDATAGGRQLVIPDQGTWTIDATTGIATFDPLPGFVGVTTPAAYSVSTTSGTSATSTLSARVTAVTPTAVSDAARTPFRTPATVPVLDNDRAGADTAPLDSRSVVLTSPNAIDGGAALVVAGQGRYDVTAAGAIAFTPEAGFTGSATPVSYRVLDANGTAATATLTVSVDLPPAAEAVADTAATTQNIDVTIDVLANDRRPDGVTVDPASVIFTSGTATDSGRRLVVPNEGTYTIDPATAVVTFDPLPAFTGTATPVSYRITDGFGRTSTAPVTVTVRSANPDARDDSARTGYREAVTIDVLRNDLRGAANAALVPSSVRFTSPQATDSGHRLAVAGEGVWTVDAVTGAVTFTPDTGFSGPATPVGYRVADSNTATDTATVDVTVDAPAAPTASPDTATTPQNVNVTVNPLANDTSATGEALAGSRVHFTSADATNDGRRLVVAGQGTYVIDPVSGVVTFDPLPEFTGAATAVGYEVTDSFGSTASSTITVTVTPIAPVAVDDTATTAYNTPVTVDVSANDRAGAASAPLSRRSLLLVDQGATDAGRRLVIPGQGTYELNSTSSAIIFTPLSTFTGTATGARYRILDANGSEARATLTVTVALPAAPVARADTATTPQNTDVTIDPSVNDSGTGLDRTSVIFTDPAATDAGKTLVVAGQGTWRIDPTTGAMTFDPVPGFVGDAVAAYRITDGFGQTTTSTATVTVTAVSPIAVADSASTPFGTPVTVRILDNDSAGAASAPLDPTTVVLADPAATDGGKRLDVPGQGLWTIDRTTGAATFTPSAGFAGAATPVTYSVRDSNGTTASAPVRVSVELPAAPIARADSGTTPQNVAVTMPLLDNDETFDGRQPDPSTVVFTSPDATAGGTLLIVPGEGRWQLDQATGTATFTPEPQFTGAATAVEYRMADAFGRQATATLAVQVVAITPIAVDDEAVGPFQNPVAIDVLANDRAGADSAPLVRSSVRLTSPDATDDGRRLVVAGEGTWTVDPVTGVLTFDPVDGFTGEATAVDYRVTDANGTRATAEVRVTVGSIPRADDDPFDTPQNVTLTVDPLENDVPGDGGAGTPGTIDRTSVAFTSPDATAGGKRLVVSGEGVYTIDPQSGQVTFDPDPGFSGRATPVGYTWVDSFAGRANARLLLSVTAVTPSVVDDTSSTPFGRPVSVPVLGNDAPGAPSAPLDPGSVVFTDPDATDGGRTLVVPDEGTWSIDPASGVVTFTPAEGFAGVATTVQYRVTDANGTRGTAGVTVTVERPTPPVAVDDDAVTPQNVTVTVPVLGNDTSPAGSSLVPSSVRFTSPTATGAGTTLAVDGQGTWTVTDTGAVRFDPLPGFTGAATPVAYAVSDPYDQEVTATVTVTVTSITPRAQDDSGSAAFDQPATIAVLDNDAAGAASAPLDPSTVTLTSDRSTADGTRLAVDGEGVWTVDRGTGTVTFTPEPGFTGEATPVEYSVADANGTRAAAIVRVGIALPAPPAATSDAVTTGQNVTVTVPVLDNDRAPAGSSLDPASVRFTAPGAGDGGTTLVVPGEGTWRVTTDGRIAFDPEPAFIGPATPVAYGVSDPYGQESTATVSATVTAITPTVTDDRATTAFDRSATVDVLANDRAGAATAPLTPTSVVFTDPAATDGGKRLVVPGQGTWTVDPQTGTVGFAPVQGYVGTTTPVGYSVADGNGTRGSATITVTVAPPAPPAAVDDTASTAQNVTVSIDLLRNDTVPTGSALDPASARFTAPGVTADGRSLVVPGEGVWTMDAAGTATFDPEPGFTGTAMPVGYRVSDRYGQPATAQVTVTVTPVTPSATDDAASTPFDAPITVDVVANDAAGAASAPLVPASTRFTSADATDGGTRLERADQGVFTIDPATGLVRFEPVPGFVGRTDAVSYRVADANGTTATAALVVTVLPPAAPVPVDDARSTPQNVTVTLRPLDNDAAAPGSPLVVGSLAFTSPQATDAGTRLSIPGEGVYTVDPLSGQVAFDPEPAFRGAATPVEYRISDRYGQSGTARITITVGEISPIARDDEAATRNAQPVTVDVLANDAAGAEFAPLDPASVRFTSPEATDDGRALLVPGQGEWRIDPDTGSVTFSPVPGFEGPAGVEYSVADTNGTRVTAGVRVLVGETPVAEPDRSSTSFGPVTLDPLANDRPGDGAPLDRRTLRLTLIGMPGGSQLSDDGRTLVVPSQGRWVVNSDGTVTFTPSAGFSGTTTPVTYTVQDADGTVVSSTMSITMSAAPPASGVGPGVLAWTGAEPTGPVLTGLALLALGGFVLAVGRLRRPGVRRHSTGGVG